MKNLSKPRGKGYSLRLATPAVLVGTLSPWTGRPFGETIKLGLGTRHHAEALRIRDIRIGQIRQLEAEALLSAGKRAVGNIIDLTPENAASWRAMREEAKDPDGIDYVLTDELERAERAGKGREARAFAASVFRGALTLDQALEEYLEERKEGVRRQSFWNQWHPNLRESLAHLVGFIMRRAGGDASGVLRASFV